uniref:transglutaminase family protein n=1 Tax=Luteolibacter marinus TaxID=2776705 RepID=UPI001867CA0C
LTFDLVDTWNQRSIGGCQYHVVHPGGRAYDDFPLNAFVAESRRRSRFFTINKSPGRLDVAEPVIDREYPMTLDLQRFRA